MRSIDSQMSRLCGQLMSTAQNALDAQNYVLDEMEYIAQGNPDREDIRACIDEIKKQNKASESANWAAANHWSDHFDGISGTEGEETEEDDKATVEDDDEATAEEDDGASIT